MPTTTNAASFVPNPRAVDDNASQTTVGADVVNGDNVTLFSSRKAKKKFVYTGRESARTDPQVKGDTKSQDEKQATEAGGSVAPKVEIDDKVPTLTEPATNISEHPGNHVEAPTLQEAAVEHVEHKNVEKEDDGAKEAKFKDFQLKDAPLKDAPRKNSVVKESISKANDNTSQHGELKDTTVAEIAEIKVNLTNLVEEFTNRLQHQLKKMEQTQLSKSHPEKAEEDHETDSVTTGKKVTLDKASAKKEDGHTDGSDAASEKWMPLAVREMPKIQDLPLAQMPLPKEELKSFPRSFLLQQLGGSEWSPGLFYKSAQGPSSTASLGHVKDSMTYYLFDTAIEPYLPTSPGMHGAKLTPFFRSVGADEPEDLYDRVPLFVSLGDDQTDSEKSYTYLGSYSQIRFSDRVDYERFVDRVPKHVTEYWAKELSDGKNRPEWLTKVMMEHFIPVPVWPGAGKSGGKPDVDEAMIKTFTNAVLDWYDDARGFVDELTYESTLELFQKEDAAEIPGIRFWWEYLQCVGFDKNFYYALVTEMSKG